MGRKPKYTVKENIFTVEDYLNGMRSVPENMVDLQYNIRIFSLKEILPTQLIH